MADGVMSEHLFFPCVCERCGAATLEVSGGIISTQCPGRFKNGTLLTDVRGV